MRLSVYILVNAQKLRGLQFQNLVQICQRGVSRSHRSDFLKKVKTIIIKKKSGIIVHAVCLVTGK